MRLVDCLERADVRWCVIGGIAVNHWAAEPMVTRDVDFVVAADDLERAISALEQAGFLAERFDWSINFKGRSAVSLQLRTEDFYRDFPSRAVAADVHGILMRVASLQDTLSGKVKAWSESGRRPSKRLKDVADIARLVEAHPDLWDRLPDALRTEIPRGEDGPVAARDGQPLRADRRRHVGREPEPRRPRRRRRQPGPRARAQPLRHAARSPRRRIPLRTGWLEPAGAAGRNAIGGRRRPIDGLASRTTA
jgi:hypothetical protein